MAKQGMNRRAEYADATRRAIIDAARRLFAERGFFAVKVEDIATEARVAAGTVYVAGGKHGLLRLLGDDWGAAPILQESLDRLPTLTDPAEVLRLVAASSRALRETHGDVIRVIVTTAPHDETAAKTLRQSTERYRGTLWKVAEHLRHLDGLADGLDVTEAADVLWFYFGYSGYFTLTDDVGWTLTRAEDWLLAQCSATLLRHQGPRHPTARPGRDHSSEIAS